MACGRHPKRRCRGEDDHPAQNRHVTIRADPRTLIRLAPADDRGRHDGGPDLDGRPVRRRHHGGGRRTSRVHRDRDPRRRSDGADARPTDHRDEGRRCEQRPDRCPRADGTDVDHRGPRTNVAERPRGRTPVDHLKGVHPDRRRGDPGSHPPSRVRRHACPGSRPSNRGCRHACPGSHRWNRGCHHACPGSRP